jgi:hypothetical protein
LGGGFIDGDLMAVASEIEGGGKAGHACADDGDSHS